MLSLNCLTLAFAALALAESPVFRYDACFTYSPEQPPLVDNPTVENLTLEQCAYACNDHALFGVANFGKLFRW